MFLFISYLYFFHLVFQKTFFRFLLITALSLFFHFFLIFNLIKVIKKIFMSTTYVYCVCMQQVDLITGCELLVSFSFSLPFQTCLHLL